MATPEEALNAAKVLWPDVVRIESDGGGRTKICSPKGHKASWCVFSVDWPEGVYEWPPAPQYREPTQDDVGKIIEVSNNRACSWLPRKLLHILNSPQVHKYVCEDYANSHLHMSWEYARIRIDEPVVDNNEDSFYEPWNEPTCKKPSWLPDGWRVLGTDEVIEKGDRYHKSFNGVISEVDGSIGKTPKEMKAIDKEFDKWTWIRRIEQPEIYHNGKKYRLADERDVGKKVMVSDEGFAKAVELQSWLELRRIERDSKYPYVRNERWKYAFVEIT